MKVISLYLNVSNTFSNLTMKKGSIYLLDYCKRINNLTVVGTLKSYEDFAYVVDVRFNESKYELWFGPIIGVASQWVVTIHPNNSFFTKLFNLNKDRKYKEYLELNNLVEEVLKKSNDVLSTEQYVEKIQF